VEYCESYHKKISDCIPWLMIMGFDSDSVSIELEFVTQVTTFLYSLSNLIYIYSLYINMIIKCLFTSLRHSNSTCLIVYLFTHTLSSCHTREGR